MSKILTFALAILGAALWVAGWVIIIDRFHLGTM